MSTVLVTNDDGIGSQGVLALAEVAERAGHDVWVVAPHRQSSGSAAGLWRDPDASPVITSYASDSFRNKIRVAAAHPGMIALLAMTGQLGPVPDVVLSGINDASNLGSGVLHSGTAGAAIVGAAHGAVGIAVSLYCDDQPDDAPRQWHTAQRVVDGVLTDMMSSPAGSVFNINVPNVIELDAPLVQAHWQARGCVPTLIPFIERFHQANGSTPVAPTIIREPGTDITLVEAGFATVSLLRFTGDTTIPWAATPSTPSTPSSSTADPTIDGHTRVLNKE